MPTKDYLKRIVFERICIAVVCWLIVFTLYRLLYRSSVRGWNADRFHESRLPGCVRSGTHAWFMRCRGKFMGSRRTKLWEGHRLRRQEAEKREEKSKSHRRGRRWKGRKRSGRFSMRYHAPGISINLLLLWDWMDRETRRKKYSVNIQLFRLSHIIALRGRLGNELAERVIVLFVISLFSTSIVAAPK